jgi:hypothetical protein
MANNRTAYGFRWVGSMDGSCYPKPLEFTVASGYQAQVSAEDVGLSIGDPVEFNTGAPGTGMIELGAAGGSPSILWGVIAGFSNARIDANGMSRPTNYLPGGTTWTTEQTRSKVLVVPFGRNIWEVDVTGNDSSEDTLAEYRAFQNKCCNLTYTRDVSNPNKPKAGPSLLISDVNDDEGDFRILMVSLTQDNQDFSGNRVKLRVVINESGEAPFVTDPGI